MVRVGVLLSGCGVFDGSEIHEAVLTLLALDRAGAEIVCMAPNMDQMHVVNHFTNEEMKGQSRNVLVESARIARGNILDVAKVKVGDLDALIIPGGFGAAKNLCTFAVDGPGCRVQPEVRRLVSEMAEVHKPIGAICIAPAVLAAVLGAKNPTITIGTDRQTANALESMGAVHRECPVDKAVVDSQRNLVTTPAYMLGPSIKDVAKGIEDLVQKVLGLVKT
ncbi:MAG TPA: isoprenoid biosynthesis glyoxalase ElbB [bacterium]|nr:isoprenoid biosynthesis glyoxalase ElbB [bacterium]HQL60950.1 isoprenoid biosynthesis glyoxalase ElbB [bacterium]